MKKYLYMAVSLLTLFAAACNKEEITKEPNYGNENGYEYIDLGLPSGTKWATMNVGATKPEDYGDYYAWGETETKSVYSWNTYFCKESDCGTAKDPLKDYVYPNKGKNIAGTQYDVAHVKWGGKWKMPTKEQIEELYDENNCSREWKTDYNGSGNDGWLFTSKVDGYTSQYIFLPVAGYRYDSTLSYSGSRGYCWSATPDSDNAYNACYLYFNSGKIYFVNYYRYCGKSVRPVLE